MTDSNAQDTETTPTISTEHTQTSKRRKVPPVFKFKAKSLCISLHAPIETHHRKNKTTTGVPSGKTNKDVQYDLDRYILSSLDQDGNASVSSCEDFELFGQRDEEFVETFTLSKFRTDLMIDAVKKFPEEYAPKKKALGKQCKLYFQKLWNSSSWSEIATTDDLIRNLKDQMDTKGRVRNGILTIKMAFGKAKMGKSFMNQNEIDEYTEEENGEGFLFSQNEIPSSPFERRVGVIMRTDTHTNPTRITELIARLYRTESCKLYYGFLNEHVTSFIRIIAANICVHKDDSVFAKAMKDNAIPSDEELDEFLISILVHRHNNDIIENTPPNRNKYPPTNEDAVITPPFLRDWKKNNDRSNYQVTNPVASNWGLRPQQLPHSALARHHQQLTEVASPKIVGLTFKKHNYDDEISAIINGNLSQQSTMSEVIEDYSIADDLMIHDLMSSKFLIKKKNGSFFTLKYDRFALMTVKDFISLANVNDDYMIEIKELF